MNVCLPRRTQHFRTVTFDASSNSVQLIDQQRLPHELYLADQPAFSRMLFIVRIVVHLQAVSDSSRFSGSGKQLKLLQLCSLKAVGDAAEFASDFGKAFAAAYIGQFCRPQ